MSDPVAQQQIQEEIQRFIDALVPKVENPQLLRSFTKDIEEEKSRVWPQGRLGQFGLQLLPTSFITKQGQPGVGYYFEFEIELEDPKEKHMLTWFLPVDPSRDVVVSFMRGDQIQTWSKYAGPGSEQKLH